MNFKDIKFDYVDDFQDELLCYFKIKVINEEFINRAKQIDKNDFNEDCFSVYVSYNIRDCKFHYGTLNYISQDNGIIEICQLLQEEIIEFKNIAETIG